MKLIRIHCHSETEEKLSIHHLDLHPGLLRTLAELGMIELDDDRITAGDLKRAYKVLRLRRCLGVNLTGASIIVELLERMEEMQDEITRLKRGR